MPRAPAVASPWVPVSRAAVPGLSAHRARGASSEELAVEGPLSTSIIRPAASDAALDAILRLRAPNRTHLRSRNATQTQTQRNHHNLAARASRGRNATRRRRAGASARLTSECRANESPRCAARSGARLRRLARKERCWLVGWWADEVRQGSSPVVGGGGAVSAAAAAAAAVDRDGGNVWMG
jgi:hypothetical protein